MFKKTLSLFLLILFITAPAIAGRGNGLPHGKWWNNTEAASQLNLSDSEIKILDDRYVNHRRKIIKLRARIEEEQFELNNLIDSKTINDEAVLKRSKSLEHARSKLSTERFHFFLDIRKLLGFDRYQQLKSMFQTMRNERKLNRFKNKMNGKREKTRSPHLSSYRNHFHNKTPGFKTYRGMNRLELGKEPTSNIPPYNDNRDVSEENL